MTGATVRYVGFRTLSHLAIMRRGLAEHDQHAIDDILIHRGLSAAIDYAAKQQHLNA